MNPTSLERTEAAFGKTEEQYLEEQELLRQIAEEEAQEAEAAAPRTDDDAEREDAELIELPF